jgi:hypothetical protein
MPRVSEFPLGRVQRGAEVIRLEMRHHYYPGDAPHLSVIGADNRFGAENVAFHESRFRRAAHPNVRARFAGYPNPAPAPIGGVLMHLGKQVGQKLHCAPTRRILVRAVNFGNRPNRRVVFKRQIESGHSHYLLLAAF